MKRVSASDARRNWFRLLDEVAAGEVVTIQRGDHTIVLRREGELTVRKPVPDYSTILRAPSADDAERWSWSWDAPGEDLSFLTGEAADEETDDV